MAQTGYTPISIYYSATGGAAPTSGNLVAGELAINTADGKLFYKDSAGVVQVIAGKGGAGVAGGSNTQVQYNSSGSLAGSANMVFDGSTLTTLNSAYTGTLIGGTGVVNLGSGQFYKDASGNVGIGTSSPALKLDVAMSSAGDGLRVYNTLSTGFADVRIGNNSNNNLGFLRVGGSAQGGIYQDALVVGTGGGYPVIFAPQGTERMRIDAVGQVGIGITPSSWSDFRVLQIPGGAFGGIAGSQTISTANIHYNGGFLYTATGAASYYQQQSGVHNWASVASGTAGSAATPTTVLSVSLNGALRLQGAASANGTGLTFPATQSASSDANTLDDYEEGTWTPVLLGDTGAGTYVYDTARTGGQYIKIGKLVTVRGAVAVSSITSAGSGGAYISGLPFSGVNPAGSWARTPGNLMCQGGTTATATSSLFVGFDTSGVLYFGMYAQTTTTIGSIPVTTVDDVNSIWSFTYTYVTTN